LANPFCVFLNSSQSTIRAKLRTCAHLLKRQTHTRQAFSADPKNQIRDSGKAAAVSLTFDDGSSSYWTTAAPEMTSRGIAGTCYTLVPGAETKIQTAQITIETEIGSAVPGYRCVSFAYSQGITSRESDDTNLPELVSQSHVAARTAGGNISHN
jgi:hypothetical protein